MAALRRWRDLGALGKKWGREMPDAFISASRKDPAKVIPLLHQLPWELMIDVSYHKTDPFTALLQHDHAAVFKALHASPPGPDRDRALLHATYYLAKTDPHAALETARSLPPGPARDRSALELARGTAAQDPSLALRLYRDFTGHHLVLKEFAALLKERSTVTAADMQASLTGLPQGDLRNRIQEVFLERWRNDQNILEGQVWLARQPLATLDPSVLLHASSFMKKEQWPTYLQALDKLAPDLRAEGLRKLGRAAAKDVLSESDPAAAAALLIETLAENWLKRDSLAASNWISQLPLGSVRDAAVFKLIENVVEDDLPAARQWATTIRDSITQQGVKQLFTNKKP